MLIKKKIHKQIQKRKSFVKRYLEYVVYHSLYTNKKLPLIIRHRAYREVKKFRFVSLSKQTKYCVISSRIRGNYPKFKMSRLFLKSLASNGRISGFFKI